ncbi:hypothetical protein BDP27DRAFT_58623 [Rhodocollybia butyracea]|uniref:Uncharacterized protein n=1 Tax=Rhodocollybia butyracea TaxID=206335 RepID=A0A9P5PNT3_9AGAR|nr:hypothetical protein BDP27DRAFT_58623 [Rhodocollybia butyracea]
MDLATRLLDDIAAKFGVRNVVFYKPPASANAYDADQIASLNLETLDKLEARILFESLYPWGIVGGTGRLLDSGSSRYKIILLYVTSPVHLPVTNDINEDDVEAAYLPTISFSLQIQHEPHCRKQQSKTSTMHKTMIAVSLPVEGLLLLVNPYLLRSWTQFSVNSDIICMNQNPITETL